MTAPTMECPKCGFVQPPAVSCVKCGIVVQKYLEALEARPGPEPMGDPGQVVARALAMEVTEKYRKSNAGKRAAILVFLFLVTAAGFWGCLVQAKIWKKSAATNSWPQVMGTVLSSTVKKKLTGEHSYVYLPRIGFQYIVDGREHTSRQVAVARITGQERSAGIVKEYPKGSRVKIYYNPRNPRDAVILKGVDRSTIGNALLWFGLFLLGSLGVVFRKLIYYKTGLWAGPG